jgi:hypothetical protein
LISGPPSSAKGDDDLRILHRLRLVPELGQQPAGQQAKFQGFLLKSKLLKAAALPRDERSAAALFALAATSSEPIPVIALTDVLRLRRRLRRQTLSQEAFHPGRNVRSVAVPPLVIVEESREARRGRGCHGCRILPDIPDRQDGKDKAEWI